MKGWQTKTLGEACQIKPPKAEARRKLAEADLVSFAPMEDLGIGQKFLIPMKTWPLSEVAGSYTYFANGDVLLAKITPCFENGKLGIAADLTNGIGFGSSEYLVFRPTGILSSEWLYYFLDRQLFRDEGAQSMTGAVGHKRVAKEFVENYPIPLPPLPEQHRIVAILDAAFDHIATARANCEANLLNARAIFESHLQAVFTQRGDGWVEKPLDEVSKVINGHSFKSSDFSSANQIKTIKITNVGVKEFVDDSSSMLPASFKDEYSVFSVDAGSIVIALTRTIIQAGLKVAVVPSMYHGALLNQRVAAIVANRKYVLDAFIYLYLSTNQVEQYVKNHVNTLMQPNLSINDLKALAIPLPPIDEQQEIIEKLENLSQETQRLESLYQRKLQALDDLKKSLLHQAFSGLL